MMLRCAGLAAGLWGLTHTATHTLFAEPAVHDDALARTDSLGSLALAALALLVMSAAVLLLGSGHREWPKLVDTSSRFAAATTAPAVYVAIEIATHLGTHHDGTPPFGLIAVGAAAHACVVLVARQLWAVFLDRAIALLPIHTSAGPLPQSAARRRPDVIGLVRWTPTDLRLGRAPPA
ncbi:MAG: hypothetical protein ABS81_11530 [Pseudonocardia sp. SCN 72-86]|nr:MAG: hypothetical protein ABS81_11530 [Pseudonocardia sp. SCN 72-86]